MQDKKLISIIHEYISNKEMTQTYGYVDEMVRDIMRTHREYGRKQMKPFTKYVKEVYDQICRNRNESPPSTDVKSSAFKVKRNSSEEEIASYSKRLRLETDQLTNVQSRKPFVPAVDLVNAMMVERYKMNSTAPLSNNRVPSPVTDVGSLFVIDRTADKPGTTVYGVPTDDSGPDLPVNDAELPSREQVFNQTVETCSVNTVEKSSLSNEIDQRTNPAPKITSYRSAEKTAANGSSAIPKKKKIRRTNEDNVDGLLLDRKTLFDVEESSVQFKDYPGLSKMLSESHREGIFVGGVPLGIIVTGPKGCGKSTLAEAIVGNLKIPFIRVQADELPSSQNESKDFVDDLLEQAVAVCPCALIIEDIPHKPSGESFKADDLVRRRLVALFKEVNKNKRQIWIIATALSITSVEVPIGKKGFQVVVDVRLPDDNAKVEILNAMVKRYGVNLEPGLNLRQIVQDTPAYAPGDLESLVDKAVKKAKRRMYEERKLAGDLISAADDDDDDEFAPYKIAGELNDVTLTSADFKLAVKEITPAAKNGTFFIERPNVKWDEDIGGMEELREEFNYDFLLPVTNPEMYEGLEQSRRPAGILLHGPPGCGKTLIAKAMATEACMNFLSIKGPELLRMYVGESEHMVRQVFEQARQAAPSIVFFDEIDSLCEKRDSNEGGTKVNVVNQILPILDGINDRGDVYVIGSTNRLDRLDPALLRPGRFDKHHYIGLPNAEQRHKILLAVTRKGNRLVLANDVNLEELAKDPRCENLSGADLDQLIRQAGRNRIKHICKEGVVSERAIFKVDIEDALNLLVKARHHTRVLKLNKRQKTVKISKS